MQPDLPWMKKPDSDGSQRRVAAQQRALQRCPGSDIRPSSSSDGRTSVSGGAYGLYYSADVPGRGRGSGGDGGAERTWGRLLDLVLVRGIRSYVAVLGKWMGQVAVTAVAAVMPVPAALVRAFALVRWLSRLNGQIGLDVVGEGVVLGFGSDSDVETGVELSMNPHSLEVVLALPRRAETVLASGMGAVPHRVPRK